MKISLPSPPKYYYRHGWQSWSLAAWQDTSYQIPLPKPARLRPMQYDPLYIHEKRPHGSWVGAVEMENGKTILLGALGLGAHVFLEDNQLIGAYEADEGEWLVAEGTRDEVFSKYAEALKKHFLPAEHHSKVPPTVWCSWYSFYTHISAQNLGKVLVQLDDLPFDVFQVDDGWQRAIGDWEPNEKFPEGMDAFAAKIRRTGRAPGLWLAPFIVAPSSSIYRQHPDWILRDKKGNPVSAGFNWGETIYALDLTNSDALYWLSELMKKIRSWGYDYVKLDFLYAGALPGKRQMPTQREQAYRNALETIRATLGDAYFLTCGAPIIPSLGLCDGIRIGPDVDAHWASSRDDLLLNNFAIPGTRNAIRTAVNRLWLSPLVNTDPDVAYFAGEKHSLATDEAEMLQNLALVCNYKATSDLPYWLHEKEKKKLKEFLKAAPKSLAGINFSKALTLPRPTIKDRLLGALLGFFGNQEIVLKIFDWLGKKATLKKLES